MALVGAALALVIAWGWPGEEATRPGRGGGGHKPVGEVTSCGARVQEGIQAVFPDAGTRSVAISVLVGPEGNPHLESGVREAADEADALAALAHIDRRVLLAEHDGALPCRARFDWHR